MAGLLITFVGINSLMRGYTSEIMTPLYIFKMLGDCEEFEKWLHQNHPQQNSNDLFSGYQFSLHCCLNTFIDYVSHSKGLKMKSDFYFNRVLNEIIPLSKVQATCERAVFLKNITPYLKGIVASKNYADLKKNIEIFNTTVGQKFETIFDRYVSYEATKGISKDEAFKYLFIDFIYTYLIQIANNGPQANVPNVIFPIWTKKERMKQFFEGYKYAIQFLCNKVLGDKAYKKTSLVKLHKTDSWKDYVYLPEDKSKEYNPFDTGYFEVEQQNSLDSYFYRMQKEVVKPLEKKLKLGFLSVEDKFTSISRGYKKQFIFGDLLENNGLRNPFETLPLNEKIDEVLYWYPVEIASSEKSTIGVPSFITMLAGNVALHNKKESSFTKIIVAKFIHPHSPSMEKNDYSYGILVDTSSAGHYTSEWVIYQNACGDYSGFSGREHRATEKLIQKYVKEGKVELRELEIPLIDFDKYTLTYRKTSEEESIIKKNKQIPDIIQKSRAYLFELFTYALFVNATEYKDFKVSMNIDKKTVGGEKDIFLESSDEAILVECKLNPNNCNFKELFVKLDTKLKDSEYSHKRKSIQLWFWYEPTEKSLAEIYKRKDVSFVVVPRMEGMTRNTELERITFVMQEYENKENFAWENFTFRNTRL